MKHDVKIPDPEKHLQISIVKSIVRIIAGAALFMGGMTLPSSMGLGFIVAAAGIIIAEVLGIAEELF